MGMSTKLIVPRDSTTPITEWQKGLSHRELSKIDCGDYLNSSSTTDVAGDGKLGTMEVIQEVLARLNKLTEKKSSANNPSRFDVDISRYKEILSALGVGFDPSFPLIANDPFKEVGADLHLMLQVPENETPRETLAREFYNQGIAKFQQGKFTESLENFEKALILNPNNDDIQLARIYALAKTGKLDQATTMS